MIVAQYRRLHVRVSASARTVIRAAHTRLSAVGRSRLQRCARHVWLRAILKCHEEAGELFTHCRF